MVSNTDNNSDLPQNQHVESPVYYYDIESSYPLPVYYYDIESSYPYKPLP